MSFTKFGACVQTGGIEIYAPNFVNDISSPLTSMIILHYCIVPLTFMSTLKMA